MISRCIIIYEEHLLILEYRRRFNSRVRWSAVCWCHSSWAVRCTRPFIGETARHSLHSYMVTFFTRCPDTWRYVARILGSMILHLTSATNGNGSLARLAFFDYRKAFDLIDHYLLVNKLFSLDIPPWVVRCVCDFLTARQQRVKPGPNDYSEYLKVLPLGYLKVQFWDLGCMF